MNGLWNLDPIYKGFDDPAFEGDLENLKQKVTAINAFTATLADIEPLAGLKQGITLEEEVNMLAYKLAGYASLRQAADTRDPQAGSQMGRVMGVISGVAAPEAAFKSWASGLPNLMELVESDEVLKEYTFLFKNMADSSRYLLAGRGEEIMAKMSLSGGSAWSDMQQYLTSTVPVTYRGNTTNLSSIRNLAYDADAQVRKDAYEAEIACYDRIKDAVCHSATSAERGHYNK